MNRQTMYNMGPGDTVLLHDGYDTHMVRVLSAHVVRRVLSVRTRKGPRWLRGAVALLLVTDYRNTPYKIKIHSDEIALNTDKKLVSEGPYVRASLVLRRGDDGIWCTNRRIPLTKGY